MTDLAIEYRPIADLVPYARNARTHSDEQIKKIAASIEEFGFAAPILTAGDDILAGHGRVMAAGLLDMAQVPCVNLAHLSEAQRKAYILADNRLAQDDVGAGWDLDLLKVELEGLEDLNFDINLAGFDDGAIGAIFSTDNPIDYEAEWQGMPEFNQQKKYGFRTLVIHIEDETHLDKFSKLIGQAISEDRRYIYFPEKFEDKVSHLRYQEQQAESS